MPVANATAERSFSVLRLRGVKNYGCTLLNLSYAPEHMIIRTKKKKSRVRIKRVKSDSYLTYGQSCKTYGIIRRYSSSPPPSPKKYQ